LFRTVLHPLEKRVLALKSEEGNFGCFMRNIWNVILQARSLWVARCVARCYAHLLKGRSFWCLSAPSDWIRESLLNSEVWFGIKHCAQ
jgi:hypothetical protein